ncbi:hypothetical protein Hanom_Chr08g00714591 [Helianthus anomalus]
MRAFSNRTCRGTLLLDYCNFVGSFLCYLLFSSTIISSKAQPQVLAKDTRKQDSNQGLHYLKLSFWSHSHHNN